MKMSNDFTTTSNGFPVQDITHKPKRMQGDMIKLKESELGLNNDNVTVDRENAPLEVITLERAISYYKSKSTDSINGKLFYATAEWLEELLVTRTFKKKNSDTVEKGDSNGNTEDK